MQRRIVLIIIAVVGLAIGTIGWYFLQPSPKQNLIVSTTTSLYETGFLDILKKRFESKYPNCNVSFISQGTGLAIETAKRGDADLILVHDPVAELTFLSQRYGVNRKIVAYNFFIIVGSLNDPAEIKGLGPLDALRKIATEAMKGNALWVSRGDNSGTHSKEKALWKAAGLSLEVLKAQKVPNTGQTWYLEAGTGMTATLQLANQKNAYTLTDVASFLKNSKTGNIRLIKVVDSGKETLNVYSVIPCNPKNLTKTKFDLAMAFARYLVSDEGQELFKNFGAADYGDALFKPWIIVYRSQTDSVLVQWVKEYAFFNGEECPVNYRLQADDLYR